MKKLLTRLPLLALIAVLSVGIYCFPASAETEGASTPDTGTVTDPSDTDDSTQPTDPSTDPSDPSTDPSDSEEEETEPVKSGLVYEDGVYHYYVDGTAVKSTWKKVTTAGKTYKYYFGKNTAAYSGLKKIGSYYYYFSKTTCRLYTPSAKKIITVNGKKYLLGTSGKLIQGWDASKKYYFGPKYVPLTGLQVIRRGYDNYFYMFNSKGKLISSKTKQFTKAYKYGKSSAKLFKLIKKAVGEPLKVKSTSSCFGPGKNLYYYYKNFIVYTYKEGSSEICQGQSSRVIKED